MGSRPSHFTLTGPGPLRLYSTAELLTMPPPEWLVDGIMPQGGLVGLYGAPAAGKSFTTIDLAMCVATGKPWLGHTVQKGFVVYISAEGGAGIGRRVHSWLQYHRELARNADIGWLVESIPLHVDSNEMGVLLDRLENEVQQKPVLVVVDTLARCFDGNENEQEDMGRFIAGADKLRKVFGSTVLVVHHTRLGGDRERGNTAFRAAVDTMIYVEKTEQFVEISCNKQKDSEDFDPISLELQVVEGTDSCVVVASNAGARREEQIDQMLDVLRERGPMKWDDWREACQLDRSQFTKLYAAIRDQKLVTKDVDNNWLVKGESGGGKKR